MRKKDATFNMILEACDFHGIAKFYATLFFDTKEMIFWWMTNGKRFAIKLTQFAEILGISARIDNPKKLHTG
jgi:hypothetical protein